MSQPPAARLAGAPARRALRDRRGRGLRGPLAPAQLPRSRSRAEVFGDLVLDALEEFERRYGADLSGLEFAIDDVPPPDAAAEFNPDVVSDHGVALGRLYREGLPDTGGGAGLGGTASAGATGAAGGKPPAKAVIVLYRRPVEIRARHTPERAEVIFALVGELVAEYLGKDL